MTEPTPSARIIPVGTGRFGQFARDALLGFAIAALAVAVRAALPLPPMVLPFVGVIIAICLVTVAIGLVGGIAVTVGGGFLTWYFILNPGSWSLNRDESWSLAGYFLIAIVILGTSELYRRSEEQRQRTAVAAARAEAAQQRLFAGEMSHRMKNAMAIVQALASQTFSRSNPELPKFEGRLKALADAHNLLMDHVEDPMAPVSDVINKAMSAFATEPDRVRTTGTEFMLPAQQVVSWSLALHELATNAVKYGALGSAKGWVSISWVSVEGKLLLTWQEHGGPPVAAPVRQGFGTRLLARTGMGAQLFYEPDGLRCVITQNG